MLSRLIGHFAIIINILSLIKVNYCMCLKPLALSVTTDIDSFDQKIYLFTGDKEPTDVEKIRQFVVERQLSEAMRIQLLEYVLNYVSTATLCTLKDGDIYVSIDSLSDSKISGGRIATALNLISDQNVHPSQIWTVDSEPSYKIVLIGNDELISSRIRSRGTFGPVDAIRDLVASAKKARQGNTSSVNTVDEPLSVVTTDAVGVIIDVGANLGTVSLYGASLGERVISFEPVPSLAVRLRASCVLNGWCGDGKHIDMSGGEQSVYAALKGLAREKMLVLQAGVGDGTVVSADLSYDWQAGVTNSGAGSMHSVKGSPFLDSESFNATAGGLFRIDIVTLDSVASALGLIPPLDSPAECASADPFPPIDVLKLDCEGCEPQALQGAARVFKLNPPHALVTEANEERLQAGGWSTLAYLQEIERLGYDVFNLDLSVKFSPVDEDKLTALDLRNKVHDFACLRRS